MLGEIFYWIFNMSIAATICMVPVLLLRLIKKIPRRIFIWLWLVPFIRMCIPVGISSKYSNFIRLLALIVVCFHWFNPFAWLMLKLLYSDIELACDESVLSKCDEAERKEYAYTLLSTAEKTNLFVASFGGSKIRIRIENILSYSKISILSIVSFAALVIAICYVLLTNA